MTGRSTDESSMRALIVVPTYFEAENIVEFLRRARAAAPSADILVVDDHSDDGTAELAEQQGRELGQISVLRRPGKGGLGGAYRAGFARGLQYGYDVLVEIDADLSHDPDALPQMLRALETGADLVIGSRYIPGGAIPEWSWHRRALSRWGNRYAAFVLGLDVTDATSGYRGFRADALQRADYQSTKATGYGFQIELAYRVGRNGGAIAEVPIVFTDRVRGHSKMSGSIALEAMLLVTWWAVRDRIFRRGRRRTQPAVGVGVGVGANSVNPSDS